MELRSQALAEGFAQAVLDEARKMLGGALDDGRSELFREYLVDHARPYVQGYKILSSESSDGGLILRLDVQVNKTGLREGLKLMGFMETLSTPLAASVVWPEDLDEETRTVVEHLTALTGLQPEAGVLPQFYPGARQGKGRVQGAPGGRRPGMDGRVQGHPDPLVRPVGALFLPCQGGGSQGRLALPVSGGVVFPGRGSWSSTASCAAGIPRPRTSGWWRWTCSPPASGPPGPSGCWTATA